MTRRHLVALGAAVAGGAAGYAVLPLTLGAVYWPGQAAGAVLSRFMAWSNPLLDVIPLVAAGAVGAFAAGPRRGWLGTAIGSGSGATIGLALMLGWLVWGDNQPCPIYLPLLVPFAVSGLVSALVVRSVR